MALAGVLDAVGRNSGFGYRHWIGLGLADPIASIVGPSPSPSLVLFNLASIRTIIWLDWKISTQPKKNWFGNQKSTQNPTQNKNITGRPKEARN